MRIRKILVSNNKLVEIYYNEIYYWYDLVGKYVPKEINKNIDKNKDKFNKDKFNKDKLNKS
jgi:hypothetical protein